MKTETREKVAFMAASLFDLAEMTESDLSSVVEVVGTDAIQELIGMITFGTSAAMIAWQRKFAATSTGTPCWS